MKTPAPRTRLGRREDRAVPLGIRRLLAFAFALGGVFVSLLAARLAVAASEVPATVLPLEGVLVGSGLVVLGVVRVLGVVALWAVVRWFLPRNQTRVLVVTGLFWLLWAVWQTWLLLART